MDYDILPKCSLDYIFELSNPEAVARWRNIKTSLLENSTMNTPELKENVVLGYKREPSNAGLFGLKPSTDDYQLLLEVIRRKEEHALELPYPHFDEELGWGHKISPQDKWMANVGDTGTKWT